MADLLRDVLDEQARSVGPAVDLDAVLGAGRRRVRRRRAAGAAATALCLAAVSAGAVALRPGDDEPRTLAPVPEVRAPALGLTYATGSRIVDGDRTYDVGAAVESYVRTASGLVLATADGTVSLIDRRGDSGDRLGIGTVSRDGYYLRGDADGDLVAWVEPGDRGAPEFVVYDTSRREVVRRDSDGTVAGMGAYRDAKDPAYVYAVDEGVVFRRDQRGAVAVQVATGETRVLTPDAGGWTIGDADGGRVAWESARGSIHVGDRFGNGPDLQRYSTPQLSLGGTYLSTEDGDEFHVQRTSDGAVVTPARPAGYAFVATYDWLDDDRLTAMGIKGAPPESGELELDLFTCSVSAGTCEPTASTRTTYDDLALPIGQQGGD